MYYLLLLKSLELTRFIKNLKTKKLDYNLVEKIYLRKVINYTFDIRDIDFELIAKSIKRYFSSFLLFFFFLNGSKIKIKLN